MNLKIATLAVLLVFPLSSFAWESVSTINQDEILNCDFRLIVKKGNRTYLLKQKAASITTDITGKEISRIFFSTTHESLGKHGQDAALRIEYGLPLRLEFDGFPSERLGDEVKVERSCSK